MRFLIAALALLVITGVNSGVLPAAAGNPPEVQATFVETGFRHTCVVITDGGVQCWGDNSGGQLGDGTDVSRLTPTPVVGLQKPPGSLPWRRPLVRTG